MIGRRRVFPKAQFIASLSFFFFLFLFHEALLDRLLKLGDFLGVLLLDQVVSQRFANSFQLGVDCIE